MKLNGEIFLASVFGGFIVTAIFSAELDKILNNNNDCDYWSPVVIVDSEFTLCLDNKHDSIRSLTAVDLHDCKVLVKDLYCLDGK